MDKYKHLPKKEHNLAYIYIYYMQINILTFIL